MVVELEVCGDAVPRLGHALVGFEVDLLILEAAPEPFDEDVIGKATAAVHADGNPMGAQHAGEVVVGELAALVGVEDLGPPLAQCVLQGFDAKARIEQIRQAPGQHVAAHPVHHRNQVEKPARHWDVRDIGRPHLADPLDPKPAQEVRIDPMLWCRPTGARALVNGRQSHPQHQALHPLAIHRMALRLKPRCHPPRTVEGSLQVLAIDERHQFQFVGAGLDRPIVECGAAQPQKSALPAE